MNSELAPLLSDPPPSVAQRFLCSQVKYVSFMDRLSGHIWHVIKLISIELDPMFIKVNSDISWAMPEVQ